MKKGFTLIELLAVILILGIIALIAIPTVNNIISEARYGAFKSGSDNIMKVIEEECQLSLIKGNLPNLAYTFTNGEINTPIEIKGELPNEGFIILNNECSIIDYYLKKDNLLYSNVDTNDYMLNEPTNNESIFKTMYPTYYDNIITIDFVNNLDIPESAIEIKDPSITGNNKIKSWLIQEDENYKLYVGSLSTIYGNYDSSNLFSYLSKVTNINLDNFNTSNVVLMKQMFDFCINLESIDVTKFDIQTVTTMEAMFRACQKLTTLDLSTWKCNGNYINAQKMFGNYDLNLNESCINLESIIFPTEKNSLYFNNISFMFSVCKKLKNLDLRGFNTDEITAFNHIFYGCLALENLDISSWNTSKAINMACTFQYCSNLKTLDLSNWVTDKVKSMSTMFHGCKKLTSLDLSNFNTSKVLYMSSMFSQMLNLTNLNISSFDTSNLIEAQYMFDNLQYIDTLDLSGFNVSKITNMYKMFIGCKINKLILNSWNLSNVESYEDLFIASDIKEISLNNSNYNTINKIIAKLETRSSDAKGNLSITNVDDLSKVNIIEANNKNWNVI